MRHRGLQTGGHAIRPTVPPPQSTRPSVRRRLAILLLASLAITALIGSAAGPASATTSTTATSMARHVLHRMNQDRTARGLVHYRRWGVVQAIAMDRAANMASVNTLSHDAAGGNVGNTLDADGLQWFGFGEIIGNTTAAWGRDAADYIYNLWKQSPYHAALMFSSSYNYVGVGFAYNAQTNTTYASVVFVDSRDHTRPIAHHRRLTRSGRTIRFHWAGHDRKLQVRTAGLASFDVQMRRDNGTWRTIRNDTTRTSLRLRHRARGHWFWFRVQAKDRRGNLSKWTTPVRIWVS